MSDDVYGDDFNWNEPETGLPSNFPGEITAAEFCYDSDFKNGEMLLLKLEVKSHDKDVQDQIIKVGCGKGWEPTNGGRNAQREDGQRKNFHQATHLGLMLGSLIENGEDLNGLVKAKGAIPTSVDFWKGLSFQWVRKNINYGKIGDATEDVKIDRLLPVKLLSGNKPAAGKGAAKKAAASKPASKPPVEDWRTVLDLVADGAADPDGFKEKAYVVLAEKGIEATDEVIAAIEDTESDDGVWAEAVKRYEAANS